MRTLDLWTLERWTDTLLITAFEITPIWEIGSPINERNDVRLTGAGGCPDRTLLPPHVHTEMTNRLR